MKKTFLIVGIFFVFVYFSLLSIFPCFLNSKFFYNFLSNKLRNIDGVEISLDDFFVKSSFDLSYLIKFNLTINSPYLNNTLHIGDDGNISIKNFKLYANNLSFSLSDSCLFLDGILFSIDKKNSFVVKGNHISINDIQKSLLHFQKYKNDGAKVFIENFHNFSGFLDVDLIYNNKNINGICKTKELSANSVLFNLPIYLGSVDIIVNNNSVFAQANGTLGNDNVFTTFNLTNMATPSQQIVGYVEANLTNKSVKKYIPNISINDVAKTSVSYSVKNQVVNVDYLVNLDMGADLYYKNAHLGLENFDRRLFVKTYKSGNELKITNYDYSLRDEEEITNIILGDGLFLKEDGRLVLQYLTCKTNGYAPVSVTGSFGEYVEGGFFDGDLKFDNKKNKITGDFTIIDSNYKDFYLEKAFVVADDNLMKITANGTYDVFPFNWIITAKNDFNDNINIYDMELFLDELIVHKGDYQVKTKRKKPISSTKNIDLSIDNWKIRLNKISYNRIIVENINLWGSLVDDVFKFTMSDVSFAKGLFNAKGWYNFNNHSSCVDFIADNVDSNNVADVIFGLSNQISGLASANLHVETKNKLQDISANLNFSVKEGYLPQLGSREFLVNKSKFIKRPFEFKISDLINIDISQAKSLASDINGELTAHNYKMNDIKLTSRQKYLSLLIEGDYDIETCEANLKLWGKYNKEMQRKVKILFIPLSWLVKVIFRPENTKELFKNKLNEVPAIFADDENTQAFRVELKGDLNKNIDVDLKRIN